VIAIDGIGDKDVKSLDSALLVGEKRNEVVERASLPVEGQVSLSAVSYI